MKIDYIYYVCGCFSSPLFKASQKHAILSLIAIAAVAVVIILIIKKYFPNAPFYREK